MMDTYNATHVHGAYTVANNKNPFGLELTHSCAVIGLIIY